MGNNYDVAMIHRGSINPEWVTSAIAAHTHYPWNRLHMTAGKNLVFDKNGITLHWLAAKETDWLLWSDEGMAFPHDAIEKLVTFTDEPAVVSALWWHYEPNTQIIYPGIFYSTENGRLFANLHPKTPIPDKPTLVLGTGGGFIAIHRKVAQAILDATEPRNLDYPFFSSQRISPTSVTGYSETFCIRVSNAGYPYWLLPDVKVTHYETIGLTGRF